MRHGVGIVDHIEDRIVGLKVRDIYEVPAAAILLKAHRELERLVGTIHQNQFKPELDRKWAYLVYAGLWWEPLRTDLEAYIEHVNQRVTGTIGLKLFKGNVRVVTRESRERGLRRPARDVRRVRRAVLPAGVAGLHRDLVAAVADGPAGARAARTGSLTACSTACSAWPSGRARRSCCAASTARPTCPEAAARRPAAGGGRRRSRSSLTRRREPTSASRRGGCAARDSAAAERLAASRGDVDRRAPPELAGLVLEAVRVAAVGRRRPGSLRVRGRWTAEPRAAGLPALWLRARRGAASLRLAARHALRARPGRLARHLRGARVADRRAAARRALAGLAGRRARGARAAPTSRPRRRRRSPPRRRPTTAQAAR